MKDGFVKNTDEEIYKEIEFDKEAVLKARKLLQNLKESPSVEIEDDKVKESKSEKK